MKKIMTAIVIFDILMGALLAVSAAGRTFNSTISVSTPQLQSASENVNSVGSNTSDTNTHQNDELKKIALTFDDGPHPSYTEELLDGLKSRGIHATFFVTGENAEVHPDIIKRMDEEGHLIGNHTYSHIQLTKNNREEYKNELIKTNEIITEITGKEVTYVRPPYGTWDKTFEKELNMFPVLWDIDPRDWCSNDASCVAESVIQKAGDSEIILLHDYYGTSVEAALMIVDELTEEGYIFVTVDEIMFD